MYIESPYMTDSTNKGYVIYNKKYKFFFPHESQKEYSSQTFLTQDNYWPKGPNHFILNNFEEFIKRYNKRIDNFKNYLNTENEIIFLVCRYNNNIEELSELTNIIKIKYPNLKFSYKLYNWDRYCIYDYFMLMKIDKDNEEVKRLNIINVDLERKDEGNNVCNIM